MAVQIVITDNSVSPLDGSKNVTAVFWLNAPANRQIAKPNFISAVPVASFM